MLDPASSSHIAGVISALEESLIDEAELSRLRKEWQLAAGSVPVLGITGTGGAGKSSVTDEILNRFLSAFPVAPAVHYSATAYA